MKATEKKAAGKSSKRVYSSFKGESTPALENLVQRNFLKPKGQTKWLTEHT